MHTDRQVDRQRDIQMHRETDIETCRHTHRQIFTVAISFDESIDASLDCEINCSPPLIVNNYIYKQCIPCVLFRALLPPVQPLVWLLTTSLCSYNPHTLFTMQSATLSSFYAPGSHQLVFIVYFIVYLVLALCSCIRVAVCLLMFFILKWIYIYQAFSFETDHFSTVWMARLAGVCTGHKWPA